MKFRNCLDLELRGCFWIHLLLTVIWIYPTGSKEYCNSHVFEPSCGSDEVILIEKADFGRMRYGKCVTEGDTGCKADALGILDKKCSGRRSCEVRVADPLLDDISTCNSELKTYLDVEYRCLKVYNTPIHQCQSSNLITLAEPSGFLPYVLTEEAACGVHNYYVMEAKVGHTLNFTLYDFEWNESEGSKECPNILAVIKDPMANTREEVCGRNGRRVRHVITTVSHTADVVIYDLGNRPESSYFLLHYQVLGCPDPKLGAGMELKRSGNVATVTCSDSRDQKWKMTCVNGNWKGNRGNCTNTAAVTGGRGDDRQWMPFPLDISLALVASVAFVVGCCIFVVGIFILKRNNFNEERKRQDAILLREAQDNTFGKYPSHPDPSDPGFKVHPTSSSEQRSIHNQPTENEYAYVTDFPPPPSPKTLRMCGAGKDQSQGTHQMSRAFKPQQHQGQPNRDCYQMRVVDPRPVLVPEPYFELDHCSSDRRNSS